MSLLDMSRNYPKLAVEITTLEIGTFSGTRRWIVLHLHLIFEDSDERRGGRVSIRVVSTSTPGKTRPDLRNALGHRIGVSCRGTPGLSTSGFDLPTNSSSLGRIISICQCVTDGIERKYGERSQLEFSLPVEG